MRTAVCLLAALAAAPVFAERLTLERIHADPALAGPGMRNVRVSPDGARITFLRGRPDNQFQLDLWEFNMADKTTRRLVDSKLLMPAESLSLDEKARRERTGDAAFNGIVNYSWSPDGKQLLVPAGGDLYLVDAAHPEAARKIATGDVFDPQISPKGRYVSFIRDQNLAVIDLVNGDEKLLTTDGKGTVHNGEAEFVAQEEMEQTSGYYWAPDDTAIAYKRFDESQVPVVRRFDIFADRTEVIEQRYPAAGDPNVLADLMIVRLESGERRKVDIGAEKDIYLVRADWSADSKQLIYQRQTRDQKRLDLVAVDAQTLAARTLLSETSATWVNILGAPRFLESHNAFLWLSERSGHRHLYLIGMDGKPLHAVSSGAWGVEEVLAVDEKTGRVFVASNRDDVIDKHVYALALDGSSADRPLRITKADGWHEAAFSRNGTVFVDTFSDPATPPQVAIRAPDGALVGWLDRNDVNPAHPYARYQSDHLPTTFGTLRANDGQTLHYAMIKPSNFNPAGRYPVFLYTYGGPSPGAPTVSRRWGALMHQYMAQQGFVVFMLDNRGTPRRERKFTDVIYQNLGKYEVQDQITGIDWLAKQKFVDPKRIGVYGKSYGGFMTLRLLSSASDKIALGVAVAPVTDWALYDTHYTEHFLGAMPKTSPDVYMSSGVFAHLDGLKSPLLLVHGMADDNVLFANTTRLIDALVNRGTQFELMTYPGAKHFFSSRAHQRHLLSSTAAFFKKHLKP